MTNEELELDELIKESGEPAAQEGQGVGNQEGSNSTLEDDPISIEDLISGRQGESGSWLDEALKAKGIESKDNILFEDEHGGLQTRTWDSLTSEEKAGILGNTESIDDELDNSEIELLNYLRTNNLTPKDYLMHIQQEAYNRAKAEFENGNTSQYQPQQHYTVDDYSDEELYVFDLKNRNPELSDEELGMALQRAQETPELFQKQAAGIRNEYRNMEIAQQQAELEQQAYEQQVRFNQFADSVGDSLNRFSDIGMEIELDDQDKTDIADLILGRDANNESRLAKAIKDPDTLVQMAWFALKGKNTINSIVSYYNNQIEKVRNDSYRQGLEAGKKSSPSVVRQTSTKKDDVMSIDDLI